MTSAYRNFRLSKRWFRRSSGAHERRCPPHDLLVDAARLELDAARRAIAGVVMRPRQSSS